MSFQGADVDGLDRTANKCLEGAEFADTVAKALEILVAALEAMSWTGFAAALAAYLKAVVIPWVKYIAKCLRIFGGLLQLASSKQKTASQDVPQISIPATAWNPPPAPAPTGINPPVLASPQPAIQQTDAGTGAQTGGGTSVAPITSIGRTDGGASTGRVTGGGTVTTTTGISPDGELWTRTTVTGGGSLATPTAIGTSGSGITLGKGSGSGSGSGTASAVTPAIGDCFGNGSTLGSGSAGSSGSGTGVTGSGGSGSSESGGSIGGPSTGSLGSGGGSGGGLGGGSIGSGGGSGGGLGGGSIGAGSGGGTGGEAGTGSEASTSAGDPGVQSTPLASRAILGHSAGGTGTSSIEAPAPVAAGGAGAALAAAPLGLAGVGGAALAALRAKSLRDGDEEEDDAL